MKIGRNDPCHCGSGQKYKKCCEGKDDAARSAAPMSISLDAERVAQANISKGAPPRPAPTAPKPKPPTRPGSPMVRRRAV
jgi:hypothetical protein